MPGVGLFAVALASRGLDAMTAVEQDTFARADLVANTTGVWPQIGIVGTSVEDFLVRRSDAITGTVIVDPPRTGLSQTVVERLSERGVSRLVYVSCDVATFSRDVRRFREAATRSRRSRRLTCSRTRRTSSSWRPSAV